MLAFDFVATVVFALQGAILAANADFDLFGVLVVGFVTALGGGIIRDVLLGSTPPASLQYMRFAVASIFGGLIVALLADRTQDISVEVLVVLDAAGIAAYTASGARKSLEFGTTALTAVLLGCLTAVGGGILRDVLLSRVPLILVAEFYATASLAGAIVLVVGLRLKLPATLMMFAAATTCFLLRLLGYTFNWSLPTL